MAVAPRARPEDHFTPAQWQALQHRSPWRGLCIAAVAVLVSMVTGPLGYKSLSIGAAVSAAIIAAALLWHTLRAAAPKYKR